MGALHQWELTACQRFVYKGRSRGPTTVLMEQQPKMMEKKGEMEMPMTGGPSLGLLLLPAAALLVGMGLMAGYVVRRRR
jgi:hypothetical protein